MKSIFDKTAREELVGRINNLTEKNTGAWGKMNIHQMLKHCTFWDEWILGLNKPTYKQEFLGRIFGKIALKGMIKDENPFKKNIPTSALFKATANTIDIEAEKKKWISLIDKYEYYSNPAFIHDFFGKMTKDQIGILAYKHTDHHLRQFNS